MPRLLKRCRPRSVHLLGLALVFGAGCGPTLGDVAGTVTFRGERVPSGTIAFVSQGAVREAAIQDGAYEVTAVPPGEAIVVVVSLDPQATDPYENLNKVRQQMVEKETADAKRIDAGVVTDTATLAALQQKRHRLPLAYASPDTSQLRFTVAAGFNSFDIRLVDRAGKP